MRRNFAITIGLIIFLGLLMPSGMLLAHAMPQPPAVTSNTANWHDVEQASHLLNRMQDLALNVKREVGRIQVQELQLGWRAQAQRLALTKDDIDTIGSDLLHLDGMRSNLEPWQQSLVKKVTPDVHEMVYQTDAALNTMRADESRVDLAMTQYPQNINLIYKNANEMAGTIGTVTQYAHAEEKMAELDQHTNGTRS